MTFALKGMPVSEMPAPPGVMNIGGEWYYDEFSPGNGVASLGLEEKVQAPAPSEEERKSILDLFKN
jgi:penicillin-binding protein 1A